MPASPTKLTSVRFTVPAVPVAQPRQRHRPFKANGNAGVVAISLQIAKIKRAEKEREFPPGSNQNVLLAKGNVMADSQPIQAVNVPQCSTEYRTVPNFPAYRVGRDGSCQTRWHARKIGTEWRPYRPVRLKNGYLRISLCDGTGVKKQTYVHSLVLELFVGPRPDGADACHSNGNPLDNRVENLRWDSREANLKDREQHGTLNRGSRNGQARLNEADVAIIREMIKSGERTSVIARAFCVAPSTISSIKSGHNWGA